VAIKFVNEKIILYLPYSSAPINLKKSMTEIRPVKPGIIFEIE
tara:strand:- start:155 stop:283 length:129 start_codon:yes stop_codon:yes gene_type:complete